jgi:2-keto-3-deoxy-L-fuconate dehydrogenase
MTGSGQNAGSRRSDQLAGICVILGAGGTLGGALVRAFTGAGAEVIGADMRATGDVVACDVTSEADVQALFNRAQRRGEIRCVVHAAGRVSVSGVAEADLVAVRELLDVNLLSCFVTAKVAMNCLSSGSSLTFIASHAALHGAAGWAAYGASKAGVVNLTQALAQETGARGVRVNCVSPGSVESPMMDHVLAQAAARRGLRVALVKSEAEHASPLGRFATADEVAGVCVFLASPAAGYITGANVVVNGGERPG